MGRRNACTTKNSDYKIALLHTDGSKNDSLYKMVVAKPIFRPPKDPIPPIL